MRISLPARSSFVILACLATHGVQAREGLHYTPLDALKAEWDRQTPVFTQAEKDALPFADRKRLDLSIQRIGAPGAPSLLPPELETPTLQAWEARALSAKSPEERFTALFFLNRLKSPQALSALQGLSAVDAQTWPRHLHLEQAVAAARINGGRVTPGLALFLGALPPDPARQASSQLRLVLAGIEPGDPVLPSPPTLSALDAWNRGPWPVRAPLHLALLEKATAKGASMEPGCVQRLFEGLPPQDEPGALEAAVRTLQTSADPLVQVAALDYLQKRPALEGPCREPVLHFAKTNTRAVLWPGCLALLRKYEPAAADAIDARLLTGRDPLSRASAIDDLPQAPADLEPLLKRLWNPAEYDGVQVLFSAFERWKLPEDQRKTLLRQFSQHPSWTARLDAYRLLSQIVPGTPWPRVPPATASDRALFSQARRLVIAGRPLRLRLHFSRQRQITLKLDPLRAPINVANLARLTRSGFFNGRRVPRVVPDFVVQMGSPVDTMDGGPGYTVRCEDTLDWYGPGSVGMALSGKDTGGSQFFITTNAAPHLTGRYTRVGEVEHPEQALPLLDNLELGAKLLRVEVLGR